MKEVAQYPYSFDIPPDKRKGIKALINTKHSLRSESISQLYHGIICESCVEIVPVLLVEIRMDGGK